MAQGRTTTTARGANGRETRIGSGTRIRGRIQGEGDLVIEGHVEGDLVLRGDLTVAEGASIAGETVEAAGVNIAGSLDADVAATGPVRISASARVSGNVRSNAVYIEDGARFSGMLDCEVDLPPELGGASGGRTAARR
jgi:cytoskeletal protein CcmA (bactofilin family)